LWSVSKIQRTGRASQHVAAGAGFMLSPEAETAYAFGSQADSGAVGVKVTYEDYLTGDATHGLWISGFFEGFVW
jgi:hypothetical protein